MDEPRKVTFSIQEDPFVIAALDKIAKREGTSRSALVRRALRRELALSLSCVPTSEEVPELEPAL